MRYKIQKMYSSLSSRPIYEITKRNEHIIFSKPLPNTIKAKQRLIKKDKEYANTKSFI